MTTLMELHAFLTQALEQRGRKGTPIAEAKRPVAAALDLAERCAAKIVVERTFAPAYHHTADVIVVPPPSLRLLRRPKLLATIILHELVHFSGAASRLNRLHSTQRFDAAYNREELVAEVGAVLLSFDLGITHRPILPNHKYLAGYLATIARPDVALHVALGQAEQAATFLHMLGKNE